MKNSGFLFTSLLALVCVCSTIGVAQAQVNSRDLAGQAETLFDGLQQKRADYQRLQNELEGLDGVDLQVAERHVVDLGYEAIDDLHTLAENVIQQEKQGLDATKFRSQLEPMMESLASGIERVFEISVARVAEIRSQREDLSPSALVEHEELIVEEIAYQSALLQKLSQHLQKEEALGLSVTRNRLLLVKILNRRARTLSGHLAIAHENIVALEKLLIEVPEDSNLKKRAIAGHVRFDGLVSALAVTVKIMKELGLETTKYRRHLIQATGDLSTDILNVDVLSSLLGQWLGDAKKWAFSNGGQVLFKTFVFLLILLVFRVLARLARRLVIRGLNASKVKISQLLEKMITSMVSKVVMIFGVLVALSQIGISLAPLLAGLGVAGFIIGFALQDLLSNFASGMMILFYRPFDVGDLVDAGGVFGKVSRMTLVSTTFLTLDNQTLVVPNSKIWGDVIKNVTAQKFRRVDMVFGIGYSDDITHAEKILEAILEENPQVLKEPKANIKVHTLGESSVDFVVRPWVATDDYWDVYWDVTREVKMRFDREGISIPFPQSDVHLYQESGK